MTAAPVLPVTAWLQQLDELRAAADVVPLRQTLGDLYTDRSGRKVATGPNGMMLLGPDAALIVAAVNALPQLTAAIRAVLELADEYERRGRLNADWKSLDSRIHQMAADRIRAAIGSVTT